MTTSKQPLSASDASAIKDAILESVRVGAHGHMAPADLADSLKEAFSLLSDPDPSEDS